MESALPPDYILVIHGAASNDEHLSFFFTIPVRTSRWCDVIHRKSRTSISKAKYADKLLYTLTSLKARMTNGVIWFDIYIHCRRGNLYLYSIEKPLCSNISKGNYLHQNWCLIAHIYYGIKYSILEKLYKSVGKTWTHIVKKENRQKNRCYAIATPWSH